MQIRIHSSLLNKASGRRRQEWELALRDVNHTPPPGAGTLTLYRDDKGGAALGLIQGEESRFVQLPAADLKPHFDSYGDIIHRLTASSHGDGMRSIETLDYAKKLIHDEAGEFIQESMEEQINLELALTTCRRIFTLIFLIATELPEALVTQHRIHL